ncbi:hypothetical protein LXA43DRAFT_1146384 [Ganoderma leucocontextum]|nr:hypothetical protein LXA43DRAFT_1146384 [Ganoderma leucocontextum]
MMRSPLAFLLAVLAFLGGHVLAELNITIDGKNITAAVFLASNDSVRTSAPACNGNNTCLCNDATKPILDCEECMFTQLITLNKRPADQLAGQASSLSAYTTACNGSAATNLTLTLPLDWDGPFGQGLTVGTTVIAVGSAFILGLFSITIVNSM